MEPTLSRINSWSTNRTLIGSDNGRDSLLTYSSIEGTAGQAPFVQTFDNRQWVDLDILSPKAVKDLRRQYNISPGDDTPGTLARGAAKLKAWIRLSKLGVDVRLRHKVSAERDEVNIYHLKPHRTEFAQDEKWPLVAELDGTALEAVAELEEPLPEFPDTSRPSELGETAEVSRPSTDSTFIEPLPRYEPRSAPVVYSTRSNTTVRDVSPERLSVTGPVHERSYSQDRPDGDPTTDTASIVVAEPDLGDGQDTTDSKEPVQAYSKLNQSPAEPRPTQYQHLSEQQIQDIVAILQKTFTDPVARGEENIGSGARKQGPADRLHVTAVESYETETDAEAPVVRKTTALEQKGKRSVVKSIKRRKSSSTARSPLTSKPSNVLDDEDRPTQEFLRKPTLPKRLPASAGAEAIWQSLLRIQAKILGPEHPMTYQARSDLAHSRANSHAHGIQDLGTLRKSRDLAVQTLGMVHPWVAAFCEDLDRLEDLTDSGTEVEGAALNPRHAADTIRIENKPLASVGDAEQSVPGTEQDGPPDCSSPVSGDVKIELPKLDMDLLPSRTDTSPITQSGNAIWNVRQQPHQSQSGYIVLSGIVFEGLTNTIIQSAQWLQRNYGPEQPVQPGKVRVRWTCPCGEQLHDDFVEIRQGAARELEAYLNRPRTRIGGGNTPTSPSSSNGTGSFMGSSVGGTASSTTSWSSYGFTSTELSWQW